MFLTLTAMMYYLYMRCVLGNPGTVPSTAEGRKEIYDAVAQRGEAEIHRSGFDITSMVKKPLRSKHCSKTHQCIYRFDHYCVWTANPVGGGNHRQFATFTVIQMICEMFVTYFSLSYLIFALPTLQQKSIQGVCGWVAWVFSEENRLISFYMVFYNTFISMFIGMVVFQQLWFASRNVTSNEVWFVERYRWMFKLGSRAYSLYDMGFWKNLKWFFWSGNLCEDLTALPLMNEHLLKVSRKYAASVKSHQAAEGAHGHSHEGGKCSGNAPGTSRCSFCWSD